MWLTSAVVIGVGVSLAAGAFELDRALGGNKLSWVYTAEWPLIAAYLVYMWTRLVRDTRAEPADLSGHGRTNPTDGECGSVEVAPLEVDPELAAWQDYLDRLHALSPPGGPPSQTPGLRDE